RCQGKPSLSTSALARRGITQQVPLGHCTASKSRHLCYSHPSNRPVLNSSRAKANTAGRAIAERLSSQLNGSISMITVSAFSHVPDVAKGLVRDLRVRWALEEARLAYKVRLLEQGDQNKSDYRALQPFGQVPIFEENGLVLFESGAIVLHIAERSQALLPEDPVARARAVQWVIAALNSVEPAVWNVFVIDNLYPNEEWARLRRPGAVELMNKKLDALAKRLGDQPFLDGEHFS